VTVGSSTTYQKRFSLIKCSLSPPSTSFSVCAFSHLITTMRFSRNLSEKPCYCSENLSTGTVSTSQVDPSQDLIDSKSEEISYHRKRELHFCEISRRTCMPCRISNLPLTTSLAERIIYIRVSKKESGVVRKWLQQWGDLFRIQAIQENNFCLCDVCWRDRKTRNGFGKIMGL
jgi:hypothetical protein